MACYYSPDGNLEVWDEKPEDYFSEAEWDAAHLVPVETVPVSEMKSIIMSVLKRKYEEALAGAVALADPSPVNVALESALWAVEDAEGLQFMRDKLAGEYKALVAAIAGCATVEEVQGIKLEFGV